MRGIPTAAQGLYQNDTRDQPLGQDANRGALVRLGGHQCGVRGLYPGQRLLDDRLAIGHPSPGGIDVCLCLIYFGLE